MYIYRISQTHVTVGPTCTSCHIPNNVQDWKYKGDHLPFRVLPVSLAANPLLFTKIIEVKIIIYKWVQLFASTWTSG